MSSLPVVLIDFARSCQDHFAPDSVGTTDRSVFVAFDTTVVHVNLDAGSNRAAVWTELPWSDHAEVAHLEAAALAFTDASFLDRGLVMGLNRSAHLIVMGRSVEQDFLFRPGGLTLLSDVAAAAGAASTALVDAGRRKRVPPPAGVAGSAALQA